MSGFSGKSGFSGINGTSDIRFKRDIRPFIDGLAVVSKIDPVVYKWNGLWDKPQDNRDVVSVIGQELEKIAPYAVSRHPESLTPGATKTELVGINPQPLIFLLVNSVLELEDRLRKVREKKR